MTTPLTSAPVSPYAVPNARRFARHALHVALASILVAAVISIATGDGRFWVRLVYSEAIALSSWAFIDFGRFAFKPNPHSGWPQGWRAIALPLIGCVLGWVVGQNVGDAVFGWSTFEAYRHGHRSWAKDLVITAAIGFLFSLFYWLRGRNAFHMAKAAQAERDATLAKLGLLQSQLEPHMLFNTLANLRVLIGLDPAQAQAMLDRLVAFLRATLSASRAPWHPLHAEFDRLEDYLALMAVRMGPRLAVHFELPDALRELPVPPLLLQPLVENSIKHGLEPKVAGGRIEVTAGREGATLQLTVRDTGLGLSEAATPAEPPTEGGFGLTQIRERLATLYGDTASVRLQAAPDAEGGTLATIILPVVDTAAAP